MASRAGPSSHPQGSRFPNVLVTISLPSCRHSIPTRARLAISGRIYWADAVQAEPASLFDFRDANSLVLSRLADGASWDDVEKIVSPLQDDIVVHGKLHGPVRRRSFRMHPYVKLTLEADTAEEGKRWLDEIRMRVASPDLLHRHFQGCVGSIDSTAAFEDVRKRLESTHVRNGGLCIQDPYRVGAELPSQVVTNISELEEGIEHLILVDKATAQTTKLAGAIVTAQKMGGQKVVDNAELTSRANQMAQRAQSAANITGALPGLSCMFQLVGLGARFVSKLADTKHGSCILPKLFDEVVGYLGIIMTCITEALHPRMNAEVIFVANMFRVLTMTIDAMKGIEEYLMQGKVGKTMDSQLVKEFERKVEELRNVVVNVVQSTKLLKHRLDHDTELEQDIGELNARPMLSPYFVGRTEELKKLSTILNKYGSAVISQYGGIGKTQLLVKFSENAESSLPGGAHWVTADGDVGKVLDSLATFVEKLRGSRMTKQDRKDCNIIVAVLRKCLSSMNGKWLLCLDNVDNATDHEVSKVLDMVCSIADPMKQNGWVIVTSRQGRSTLWDSMKKFQRIELGPLSKNDTMCLLKRFANSINANEADDASIISDVYRLKETNRVEFDALVGLSTILGGLPLALVQAGTYIRQLQCTFSVYLKRYEEADGQAEIAELLRRSREFAPVREEQRAILTTWKISVGRLSRDALVLLRALSMFGNAPMPERLVKRVLGKVGEGQVFMKFLRLVQKELVHGTSLVQLDQRGCDGVYDMHRLVRLFVVVEMKVCSEEWNVAFDLAANSTRKFIAQHLKEEGRSFDKLDATEVFDRHHRTWVSHALATVHHCGRMSSPGDKNRDIIQLAHIHQYAGMVLRFFGRYKEEEGVWKGQLRLERNGHGPITASALGNLGNVYEFLGKLGESEAMQLECLEMHRAIHGHDENHPNIANALGNLGNVYQMLGKLDESKTMKLECLEMQRAIYGHDVKKPSIAAALGSLGMVYWLLGKLDESETMQLECLEMKRAIYGHDMNHHSIANTLGNLGNVYKLLGKLDKAETMQLECLEMNRAIYGHEMNHHAIANALGNLGNVYELLGKLGESEAMQLECLEMQREIYGHDVNHQAIANTLGNLGNVYKLLGKLGESETMQRECLEMEREIYGHDVNHQAIADTLGSLGVVYELLGKLDESETMQLECLEMQRAIYGGDVNHQAIANTLGNLGRVCELLGKLDESERMLLECLEMQRAIYGHDVNHHAIANSLGNLGIVYQLLGKLDESEAMQLECLEMKRAIYGHDMNHQAIANTLGNLGNVYKLLGKLDKAETMQLECLEMNRAILGHDVNHHAIANALGNLGVVYELLGKLGESETMLLECLEMQRAIYGHDVNHQAIANTLGNLGDVYELLGKLDESETMQLERLEMQHAIYGRYVNH